jgi:peptide chain release factor
MNECWLHISSGQGPDECARAVALLTGHLQRELTRCELTVEVVDRVPAERRGCYASVILLVQSKEANVWDVLSEWQGSVLWVCKSPYRPNHKRKNWFIAVNRVCLNRERVDLSLKDVRVESMRARGPGGQHVNKTASAIRVTHVPSGLVATAQEERSQHRNKKRALARLCGLLAEQESARQCQLNQSLWQKHAQLKRGDAIKVFVGLAFKLR